ncbi:hypothetical protein Taro_037019 [Colocasia esculenta]|uniref:Uncharacterized protein n=1 Tax=Colocasia esculenta TaxID=4460 RepID=A0A843WJI6_COLES|nr:hypothetical protein [Colocasia esculenta]
MKVRDRVKASDVRERVDPLQRTRILENSRPQTPYSNTELEGAVSGGHEFIETRDTGLCILQRERPADDFYDCSEEIQWAMEDKFLGISMAEQ